MYHYAMPLSHRANTNIILLCNNKLLVNISNIKLRQYATKNYNIQNAE